MGPKLGLYLGEIPCFLRFVWVRQLANADCVISIAYYPDSGLFRRSKSPGPGFPNFLTGDLVTLYYTLSISHRPRQLASGRTRNAEIMESLLTIGYRL